MSTPSSASVSARSRSLIRRKGGASGWNTRRGWGENTAAAAGTPSRFASAIASAITAWWPLCTPSKLPIATAAPRSDSSSPRQPLTIFMGRSASSRAALFRRPLGHLHQRLALHHGLAVHDAFARHLHAAGRLVDLGHLDIGGHRVADTHRPTELH